MTTLTIGPGQDPVRLDIYLRDRFPGVSRARWKAALARSLVTVNGRPAPPGLILVPGMDIAIEAALIEAKSLTPDPALASTLSQGRSLIIVGPGQGPHGLLAVDKPGGLPCHPNTFDSGGTLVNALAALWPGFASAGPHALEGGLLNRLDTGTSGLVLAAADPVTWAPCHELLSRDGAVTKTYLALVADGPDLAAGASFQEVTWPIAHHKTRQDRAVAAGSPGAAPHRGTPRSARTVWRVLARGRGLALVEVRVDRAQFHQVRVHMAALGHPLVGDMVYGSPALPGLAAGRHCLHAWRCRIIMADQGTLELEAPLPTDFLDLMETGGISLSSWQ